MLPGSVSEVAKGWRVLPFSLDTREGPVEVLVAPGSGAEAPPPTQVFTNGTGLTRGPGLLNGLGFTNGTRVPGGEPLSSRGGFTNGRAEPRDDGMEMRRDLINGFAVRPDSGREEPVGGWGPRAQRRRRARRRLGEMSDRPLPGATPADDSINE
jgi:hypothetical protein